MEQKLEDRCQLKAFVNRMTLPVEERYQKCQDCSGYEKERPCYVEPIKSKKP
jgi:hypothetical protein